MREAVLSEAVLSEAVLSEPVLSEPVLSEAVLSEPVLSEAVLTDCRPRSRRSWSTRGRWTPWWTFRTCLDPEPAGHGVGRASCDR